jgi:hypothetical protein
LSKKLNFFPYYKPLLKSGLKTTTLRLGNNNKFDKSDLVTITVGWSERNSQPLYIARVLNVILKKIRDLSEEDLEGESPDCAHKDSIEYVLSAIYRKIVGREDYVTVIKWEDIEREG